MMNVPSLPPHGLVKIDGLREPAHAVAAAAAGADLIGFIFAPTRRQVTPDQAADCIQAARGSTSQPIIALGVFVNATRVEIERVHRIAGLDFVQLHGDESPEFLSGMPVPAIKAFKPKPGAQLVETRDQLRAFAEADVPPVAFVIDGYAAGQAGGTGSRADWNLVADLAREFSVFLAGGLNPENVGQGIQRVRPLGVDVSSGVEIDGVKSELLIDRFVANARAAFGRSPTSR